MTLDEYNQLKKDIEFIQIKVNYNIGLLRSRWIERECHTDDVTHDRDIQNLISIYKGYEQMAEIIKGYIS